MAKTFLQSILWVILIFGNVKSSFASQEILYFSNFFGNIHQSTNEYSETISTIECGRAVKVFGKKMVMGKEWKKVSVGTYKGYIRADFLTSIRPSCFQKRHPRFFESFTLEISEHYYWARLYDLYIQGRTRVK